MNEIKNYKNEIIDINNLANFCKLADKYNDITSDINSSINNIFEEFLEISVNLFEVKSDELVKCADYKNIYDYAKYEFELGNTTVKNLIGIADRFCITNDNGSKQARLLEEYKQFGYSQLVELLSVSEIDFNSFTPTMSVRQIKQNKLMLKCLKAFDEITDINIDTSIISTYKNEILSKFNPKYDLTFIFEDKSLKDEKEITLKFLFNSKDLFYIKFALLHGKFMIVLHPCNYNYQLFNAWQIEISSLEQLIDILSTSLENYNNSLISKNIEKKSTKENTPTVPVILSYDEIKERNYKYSIKLMNYIFEKNNNIFEFTKFQFESNDDLRVSLSDNLYLIIKGYNWNEFSFAFYCDEVLLQEIFAKDLLSNIIIDYITGNVNGQTFDQEYNEKKSIILINGEHKCPKCNFILDSSHANFCSKCGQPLCPSSNNIKFSIDIDDVEDVE